MEHPGVYAVGLIFGSILFSNEGVSRPEQQAEFEFDVKPGIPGRT